VAGTAGILMLLWFDALGAWQFRGCAVAVGLGAMLVVKSTTMFEAASNVEPLPRASLKIRR
jgi:hypothetical protein